MITDILKGQNVLLICPEFHHYHLSLIAAMTAAGANVYYVPTIEARLNRLFKIKSPKVISNYYADALTSYYNKDINLLFQIRGENIDPGIYSPFIKNGAKLVMYQWDSIKNYDYTPLIPYFNKAYSFDRVDCEKYNSLSYLPLFHEIGIVKQEEDIYDLLNVSSFAYWRYKAIDNFYKLSVKYQLKTFIRLWLPLKTYIKFYATGNYINSKLLTVKGIKKERYIDLLLHSKVVIDIPSPEQTGLTIRSIETLAAKKKLITNNRQIMHDFFYSPDNILVLGEQFNEDLIIEFIKNDRKKEIDMSSLHITNWLFTVLK